MTQIALTLILCLFGYLAGSLLFAPWVCRVLNAPPPHLYGSRNPGATNVYRIAGPGPAMLTLLGDALKGFVPVWLAQWAGIPLLAVALVALCAIVGHMLPVFSSFRGGKGVATTLGSGLALAPQIILAVALVWLIVAKRTRTSAIASIVAALSGPLFAIWLQPELMPVFVIIALIILVRHRDNLIRLREGREHRL